MRRPVCRVPVELVEYVVSFAGEGGEAVAQGLQGDGQAVVLILAKARTDEQGLPLPGR